MALYKFRIIIIIIIIKTPKTTCW